MKLKNVFSDREVITILHTDSSKKEGVFKYLYSELNNSLKKFILSNGGNTDDANDIIQDAIIILYEKIKNDSLKINTSVIGYLYQTGKYLWYEKQRKTKKFVTYNHLHNNSQLTDNLNFELFDINKTVFVESLLNHIGDICKSLLIHSIYEKKSMKEITKLYNLKNEQVARNKKHKCLKKLRGIIEESSYFKFITRNISI